MRETMRVLAALALIAGVIGGIMHFWPQRDPQIVASPTSETSSDRTSGLAPSSPPRQTVPPTSAPSPAQAPQPATVARPSPVAARIALLAPDTVRHGDNVSVTIDMQALRAMRQFEFAVTYDKSVLRLLNSAPGEFAQQQGTSVHFEESSEGFVMVRIDVGSGVIAGAGSVAVLEFQALRRGTSPLLVQDITYVEYGNQSVANVPDLYERSITVE
jgi:hypothetical protein